MPLHFRLPTSSVDIVIVFITLGLLGYVAYKAATYKDPVSHQCQELAGSTSAFEECVRRERRDE